MKNHLKVDENLFSEKIPELIKNSLFENYEFER